LEKILLILAQLTLVTLVYYFAYKSGYKASQAKAEAVVKEFTDPVNNLFDKLNQEVNRATEAEKKKET
jgi:hypothetical protein